MNAENRGRGLCIELAVNIFGVTISYWVDYGMNYVRSDVQFRFPIALQILFAVATLVGAWMLPESPRWLVAHDRLEEAKRVLWRIRPDAKSIDMNDPQLGRVLEEIRQTIVEERRVASGSSFRALLKDGEQRFRYRTLLGIGGQFMQQISGINLITYVSADAATEMDS